MGFLVCYGACKSCGVPMGFNPDLVPSIRIDGKGPKEAICVTCALRWCEIHGENPEDHILSGAYEPQDEAPESY